MNANQKQTTEIIAEAKLAGVSTLNALAMLKTATLADFKRIGAKGIVECAAKCATKDEAASNGGVLFSECTIIKTSEKAYLLYIPAISTEKWIAKSIIKAINGNTIIPFWAIKN